MPPNALQSPKLTESQRPIVLSELEAGNNRHIADILRDIAIRMFESRLHGAESSEVFVDQTTAGNSTDASDCLPELEEAAQSDTEEYERMGEQAGGIYLAIPERAQKSRTSPEVAAGA